MNSGPNRVESRVLTARTKHFSLFVGFLLVFAFAMNLGARGDLRAGTAATAPLALWQWQAMGSERVPAFGRMDIREPLDSIVIRLTPGEFEPASFIIESSQSIDSIALQVGEFVSPSGAVLASSALDLKLVKEWAQAGRKAVRRTGRRHLVGELLVNDDRLIRVDRDSMRNEIRIERDGRERYWPISEKNDAIPLDAVVRDAEKLLPFSLSVGERREIWMTAHVSDVQTPGIYRGTLTVTAGDLEIERIAVSIEVLPFRLEAPVIRYGLYYRGQLIPASVSKGRQSMIRKEPIVRSARWKTEDQYRRELRDMAEHGISYPTAYHYDWEDPGDLVRAIEIRREVGFPMDELYLLGITVGKEKLPKEMAQLRRRVSSWIERMSEAGIESLFFYGIDEAEGSELMAQRDAWATVRSLGGRIFTAAKAKGARRVRDRLDVAVVSYDLDPLLAREYQSAGRRIYSYANPQVGVEDPDVYRRNYGLALWRAGYDGCMTYAYQDGHRRGHGDIWNDFDGTTKWREGVFVYSTDEGVVSTVQWEGFREGVDDVRYVSTLLAEIDRLPPGPFRTTSLGWLEGLDIDRPLDQVRQELTEKILELSSMNNPAEARLGE